MAFVHKGRLFFLIYQPLLHPASESRTIRQKWMLIPDTPTKEKAKYLKSSICLFNFYRLAQYLHNIMYPVVIINAFTKPGSRITTGMS